MKITLATGIYPPDIGGPATYVFHLAQELVSRGCEVTVITYGESAKEEGRSAKEGTGSSEMRVIKVSKKGGPMGRWMRYAKALRGHASDADILYAFSSVSVGVPLWMARLKHPKKVLRLGGDFAWERHTDRGGEKTLAEWYEAGPRFHGLMNGILNTFDHVVFSTHFQEQLYERFYHHMPLHSVIENALPAGQPILHRPHDPFKLLFLGRFVAFKNLPALLGALVEVPEPTLTIVGEGPHGPRLKELVTELHLEDRVTFLPPSSGNDKLTLFSKHDVLVLPSLTEISPNAALEARTAGLPVLLTDQTGLSTELTNGTLIRPLRTAHDIAVALHEVMEGYEQVAQRAAAAVPERPWYTVAGEHTDLFRSLL